MPRQRSRPSPASWRLLPGLLLLALSSSPAATAPIKEATPTDWHVGPSATANYCVMQADYLGGPSMSIIQPAPGKTQRGGDGPEAYIALSVATNGTDGPITIDAQVDARNEYTLKARPIPALDQAVTARLDPGLFDGIAEGYWLTLSPSGAQARHRLKLDGTHTAREALRRCVRGLSAP
jgi:hypothetical protein